MTAFYRLAEDDVHDEAPAPDLPTDRITDPCQVHDVCVGCAWCPCFEDDPAGNRPPVPFPHDWWHEALADGLVR
jgi:hypothetical protein